MNKTAAIIIGLGYGDEGKGLTTDFLCSQAKQPLVIRFNGGHQAGHTVVAKDGTTHVFSSFGAGTLRGVPTYWSKHCTFSPAYLLYELDALPVVPSLYIDRLCPVTTHYDVLYNRKLEASRGENRLGSCGVGFGATITRHLSHGIKFHAGDLAIPSVCTQRLKQIRAYYKQKFEKETGLPFASFRHDEEDKKFCRDVEELQDLKRSGVVSLTSEEEVFSSKEWCDYIFEGAQGVLLDRRFGLKPYITRSNTTTQNALSIINEKIGLKVKDVSAFYVTRCYLTRHGGGPFREFPMKYKLKNVGNETNVLNEYQGSFKAGFLDFDKMEYALKCDSSISKGIAKNLVITCLDQLPENEINFWKNDNLQTAPVKQIPYILDTTFQSVWYSYHPCSDYLTRSLQL